jgi:rod shape-determining protein MreD
VSGGLGGPGGGAGGGSGWSGGFWRGGFWRGLDRAARHALPGVTIAGMIIALATPGLSPVASDLRAGFVIGSVYFWSLYRPAALPAPVVLLLGLLMDLLTDAPLGLWGVLLLLVQGGLGLVRGTMIRQSFLLVWIGFGAFAALVAAGEWLARSVLALTLLPPGPLAVQAGIATLLYPLLAVVLIRAHRGAAAPELA